MSKIFNIYLVSDFTCETVCSIARAILVQFPHIEFQEHIWPLVNTEYAVNKLIKNAQEKTGLILHTNNNQKLEQYLIQQCRKHNIIEIAALRNIIDFLVNFLHFQRVTNNNIYDINQDNYYKRINAIEFTLNHDDGQSLENIEKADIIIVGVSRTSKSPTSIYLSYRGYKVINIPFTLENLLPKIIFEKKFFVVGLTICPDNLLQIRKKRISSNIEEISLLNGNRYIVYDNIQEEVQEAKKIFNQNQWPIIDVTKRSVEETAALIIRYYQKYKKNNKGE